MKMMMQMRVNFFAKSCHELETGGDLVLDDVTVVGGGGDGHC